VLRVFINILCFSPNKHSPEITSSTNSIPFLYFIPLHSNQIGENESHSNYGGKSIKLLEWSSLKELELNLKFGYKPVRDMK